MTRDYRLNLLGFPGAQITPLEKVPLFTNLHFYPFPRNVGIPGTLIDEVQFGSFHVLWEVSLWPWHIFALLTYVTCRAMNTWCLPSLCVSIGKLFRWLLTPL